MTDDLAKRRFFAIQAMRWVGIGMVLLGLLAIYHRVDMAKEIGYVLVVVGLIDALIMPTVLARRWKSPRR